MHRLISDYLSAKIADEARKLNRKVPHSIKGIQCRRGRIIIKGKKIKLIIDK